MTNTLDSSNNKNLPEEAKEEESNGGPEEAGLEREAKASARPRGLQNSRSYPSTLSDENSSSSDSAISIGSDAELASSSSKASTISSTSTSASVHDDAAEDSDTNAEPAPTIHQRGLAPHETGADLAAEVGLPKDNQLKVQQSRPAAQQETPQGSRLHARGPPVGHRLHHALNRTQGGAHSNLAHSYRRESFAGYCQQQQPHFSTARARETSQTYQTANYSTPTAQLAFSPGTTIYAPLPPAPRANQQFANYQPLTHLAAVDAHPMQPWLHPVASYGPPTQMLSPFAGQVNSISVVPEFNQVCGNQVFKLQAAPHGHRPIVDASFGALQYGFVDGKQESSPRTEVGDDNQNATSGRKNLNYNDSGGGSDSTVEAAEGAECERAEVTETSESEQNSGAANCEVGETRRRQNSMDSQSKSTQLGREPRQLRGPIAPADSSAAQSTIGYSFSEKARSFENDSPPGDFTRPHLAAEDAFEFANCACHQAGSFFASDNEGDQYLQPAYNFFAPQAATLFQASLLPPSYQQAGFPCAPPLLQLGPAPPPASMLVAGGQQLKPTFAYHYSQQALFAPYPLAEQHQQRPQWLVAQLPARPVEPSGLHYHQVPAYFGPHPQAYIPEPPRSHLQQQQQQQSVAESVCWQQQQKDRHPMLAPTGASSLDVLKLLPINAEPTKTRQAYGMDKVWLDEFEQLFSHLNGQQIFWNLIEVETNPIIRESKRILAYRGRYIIRSSPMAEQEEELAETDDACHENSTDDEKESDQAEILPAEASESLSASDCEIEQEAGDNHYEHSKEASQQQQQEMSETTQSEEDCELTERKLISEPGEDKKDGGQEFEAPKEIDSERAVESITMAPRKTPTRFRMFIDSAKVRFCCDICGHGWTSMKGRVVFWYELFEIVGGEDSARTVGFCAYKLFGQQCDICKVENRFERPMWYPEEVGKVLNNLYNKIGQIYFGFKMPAIDKQRRAGKPKTSHNSSLCQACQDGVCTDRK